MRSYALTLGILTLSICLFAESLASISGFGTNGTSFIFMAAIANGYIEAIHLNIFHRQMNMSKLEIAP
jgi:hypothetical protein